MRIIVLDYSDSSINFIDTDKTSTEEIESLLSQQFRLKDINGMSYEPENQEMYYYEDLNGYLGYQGLW